MAWLRRFMGWARESFSAWLDKADTARIGLLVTAAAAIASAAVLLMPRLLPELQPARRDAVLSDARLPRPRPADAIVTGSIRPAIERVADPVREAPRSSPGRQRLADLQTRAILIASSWSDCDQVQNAELIELPEGGPERVMVRIRCANGTRFVLGEADIAGNRILSSAPLAAEPAPVATQTASPPTDIEAVGACEDKVRQGLPHPSSLSRRPASTGVARLPGGDALVSFDFSALNGLGFPLAYQAQCVFKDRTIARLELSPR